MNKKKEKVEKKIETKEAKKVESKKVSSFKKKKKIKKNITSGIAYVYYTFNNTIISIADESGNVVSWSSAGAKGFKGSRKSTLRSSSSSRRCWCKSFRARFENINCSS